jgi:hypothetical protein
MTHNIHKRQTLMPLAGFEPTIPAGKQPQTYISDCVATRIESTFLLEEICGFLVLYEYCVRINSCKHTTLAFFAVINL